MNTLIKTASSALLLPLSLMLAACGADEIPGITFPTPAADLEQAQVLATPDGGLLLAWTTPGASGRDLWVSTLEENAFSAPLRVNDVPVNSIPIDEMRPALAVGPGGAVAVAWTDDRFDIRAARSADGGRSFEPSIRLNQDPGNAMQEFPAVAFDAQGVLHAVWMDPRIAPEGAEEPADLYYGRWSPDGVVESNLTAEQESSVCGCCLPHLRIAGEAVTVTFRNTTEDGYRDPFQLSGTTAGVFGAPRPLSPPTWRIDACPISGPVGVGDAALWLDGSEGHHRLLWARGPDQAPEVVLEGLGEVYILHPPRLVSGLPDGEAEVLVPALPGSYLFRLEGGAWRSMLTDLPDWAVSAAYHEGRLVLVGTEDGGLRPEVRRHPAFE